MKENKIINYPSVAIVILNYNGQTLLEKYLPSLKNIICRNINIYVIDNNSKDKSIDFLNKNYPEIKIIKNQKNYGYADGYNQGLKELKEDFFVLLNSDVEIPVNFNLQNIINYMESDEKIAVSQPKILSYNNKDEFEYAGAAGGYIDKLGIPFCAGRIFKTVEKDNNQYDDISEIFWASGSCFIVKRKIFFEHDGFDEDFFAHMEEIDLCWRIKKSGYKVITYNKEYIYHLGGGTLGYNNPVKHYKNIRNNLIILLKNLPKKEFYYKVILMNLITIIWIGINFCLFRFSQTYWSLRGILGFWFQIFTLAKKRVKYYKDVNSENLHGYYNGFILYDYYFRRKRIFKQLRKNLMK